MGFFKRLFRSLFSPAHPPVPSDFARDASAHVRQPAATPGRDYRVPGSPAEMSPSAAQGETVQLDNAPPSAATAGLDASKFQPIDSDEAMAATADPAWKTAYLDPLNQIPSDVLPRIQVIDRTMVSMGLLSPEELVEIHEVGREMESYRDDYAAGMAAAERAVATDRGERERRRQQKKLEAAERRKQHDEAVAHRRATDIVYLGRGVSRGLADRRSHVEKLQAAGLPVLSAPSDVAEALSLSIPQLRWLAFHRPMSRTHHYTSFSIEKRGGGKRLISKPHKKLAKAQHWIFENLLNELEVHPSAHGFVKGRSTVTGAREHAQSAVVVGMDLRNFFPSIDVFRVIGWFEGLGYSPAVATLFGLLCTESPRREIRRGGQRYFVAVGPRALPQGACTSPGISNGIARRLDRRLNSYASKCGWRYTRYADDLTFSLPRESGQAEQPRVSSLLHTTGRIITEEGFERNSQKTRVQRPNARQSVTGIVVNERPAIDRKTIRRLRAILHHAETEGLAAQNRDNHPNFEAWVKGMIAYVEMVNPAQGERLRDQLAKCE